MKYPRIAFEFPDRRVDAGRLHDTAFGRDVAVKDGETTFGAVGVFYVANAASRAILVGSREVFVLREGDGRRHTAGRCERPLPRGRRRRRTGDVVLVDGVAHRLRVHGGRPSMNQSYLVELPQYAEHAAGAVHVFDVVA